MATNWLRYSWDITKLPADSAKVAAPLVVRTAERDELAAVLMVMKSAFSMDTGWADIHKSLTEKLEQQITEVFEDKEPLCMVLQYGNRIIGCSAMRASEEDENEINLITGPCVLHEYRSRGHGSSLLGTSLMALREAGLRHASGVVREKTIASRFLYPKFGGKAEPWISDLEIVPKVAA